MNIRLAQLTDKTKVLKLLDEMGEEVNRKRGYSTDNTLAQNVGGAIYEEIINRDDTHIFVADDNGDIVGCATFYILPNIRHGWHRGHIEDMVVRESRRSVGIGSKIFDAVKAYAREHGIKVIKLDSGIELTDAHAFYEKNGGKCTEKMYRFDL